MKTLVAVLFAFLGLPQTGPTPQIGTVEGKVVRVSNSEAIAGVQMTLVPPPTPGQPGAAPPAVPGQIQLIRTADGQIIQAGGQPATPFPTTVTDADGKFTFRNVPAGTYALRAVRQGYFAPKGPQGSYSGVLTKQITVEADKTTKADLGLVQGGVLRGLIRDPDGQPAANYAVVTAQPGYTTMGRYIYSLTGARNADDRGEYRWPGLPPGELYVGVGPRAPGPIANVQDSWARVFYPGVLDPRQARPITIPEGGEVTVNLSAQVRPWNVYKISGVAINPLPVVADPVTGVVNRAVQQLVLMPLDMTPLDNPPSTLWTDLAASSTKPNGEFVLSNVDPGRYELYTLALDQQNRRVWTGHVRVEVKDKDVTGLNIAINPGFTLRGEIVVTGSGVVRPEQVRVSLQVLDTLPPQVAGAVGAVPFDETGKFQILNLAEGRYRMNVLTPPGTYVASIQQGGVNVFDAGFTVDAQTAQAPLRVEINTAAQTVEGNVRTAQQKEAANAMVVLVPAADRRGNPGLYKTAITDNNGHFIVNGVAPGSYTALAWESVLLGAYQNAEFLEKYQTRGRAVTVQAGNRSEVQLELIQGN